MQKHMKLLLAAAILAIGGGGAMLFPRTEPLPLEPSVEAPLGPLVLRESSDGAAPPVQPSVLGTAPQRVLGAEASRAPGSSPAGTAPAVPARPDEGPPPELAARYDRWLGPQAKMESPRSASIDKALREAIPQGKPEPRTHKIVDGDTLPHLAERYLGDASRASEIHAANQKLLPQPDVLPIGVTLLIPPRTPAAGTLAEHPVRGALEGPLDRSSNESALLVPVPHGTNRPSTPQ